MKSVIHQIHQEIKRFSGIELAPQDWSLPPQRDLGDFAIPCFKLSKTLAKAPAQIANEVSHFLEESRLHNPLALYVRVSASGPYINVKADIAKIYYRLHQQLFESPKTFGSSWLAQNQKMIVEFSSPNVAKEIGLHHIRSTVLGHSLARIAELQGAEVTRLNYLGDWGTSFGKLILGLQMFGEESRLDSEGLPYMLDLYIQYNQAEKENPALENKAKAAFQKLESGDLEYKRIWKLFREISIREFQKLYQRMGIDFDFYDGESYYDKAIENVIAEIHTQMGTRISEGALVCDLPGSELPVLLKKDDGASLYITRDLAAVEDRSHRFHFDKLWYVVAIQQKLHFQQMFSILKKLNKDFADKLEHIAFGMLSFGSKTMKSREGNILFLKDVLDEGKKKAFDIINEKNPDLANKEEIAESVGMGALFFFDLSQHRQHDVKFSWEEALRFEGDTSPFIQYTHARCSSLIEKGVEHLQELTEKGDPQSLEKLWENEAVHRLLSTWSFFQVHAERAFVERDPSQIAASLLDIAKAMNHLYHSLRFLDFKERLPLELLLHLSRDTQKILARGLYLLGIRAPLRM